MFNKLASGARSHFVVFFKSDLDAQHPHTPQKPDGGTFKPDLSSKQNCDETHSNNCYEYKSRLKAAFNQNLFYVCPRWDKTLDL